VVIWDSDLGESTPNKNEKVRIIAIRLVMIDPF
jgi:hypothetical protein